MIWGWVTEYKAVWIAWHSKLFFSAHLKYFMEYTL